MFRFLLVGVVAATVALFVWQTISNTVIPWHSAPMHEMSPAAVLAVHDAVPGNGFYFAKQGMLAVINTAPDLRDRTGEMGVPLARQLLVDLVAVLLVAFAVLRLPRRGSLATGGTLALLAAAFSGFLAISDWNWYGFPFAFELSNVADIAIQGFLAGVILAWARRRFGPAHDDATEGVMSAAA